MDLQDGHGGWNDNMKSVSMTDRPYSKAVKGRPDTINWVALYVTIIIILQIKRDGEDFGFRSCVYY